MTYLYLDTETRSEQNLLRTGVTKYVHGKEFAVLMVSYAIDNGPVKLWTAAQSFPFNSFEGYKIVGHNLAMFDRPAMNVDGRFPHIYLDQCVDTMAIAARFTLPQTLKQLATVLKLSVKKDFRGTKLIRMFCVPPFRRPVGPLWEEFKQYCATDTIVLRKIHQMLPALELTGTELKIWRETVRTNERGVPVDYASITKIYGGLNLAKEEQLKRLPALTGGKVNTIFQVAAIKDWCKGEGVNLPDLTANTVEKVLNEPNTPPSVQTVLDLRATHGRSSVKKYEAMLFRAYKRRVFDGLRYYGAAPGRFSGMGTQWQNFPRDLPPSDQIDPIIKLFNDDDAVAVHPQALNLAKSILRAMIMAPKGKYIFAGDYKSIEYIILCWLCGEYEALERFRAGFDPYKDMASYLMAKNYEEIDKYERQFGKTIVLGCGYVLGAAGLVKYAQNYGVDIDEAQAGEAVHGFRHKYARIKKAWYKLYKAAVATVRSGRSHTAVQCVFHLTTDKHGRKWLKIVIPSGRALYYFDPSLAQGRYNIEIQHEGFIPNSGKKWGTIWLAITRLIENVTQALARDVLCEHILTLAEANHPIILSVHDEVLIEVNKDENIKSITKLLETSPTWAPDLPVKLDWVKGVRYAKA